MDGWITIGTKLDTKEFDKQILAVEREINDIENDMESGTMSGREFDEAATKVEKLRNRLIALKKQQQANNSEGLNNFGKSIKNAGNEVENVIKKTARLALSIFGLRSAYMAVRQASSTLAQYDEQYAKNIEYIRYALAMGIAPVLRYIVNLAAQLLSYINYILGAWFGINLFGNASAKNFAKMSKSAGSTAKSVREIKKQLAGFDEMNVLSDDSQNLSNSGSNGGVTTPSFDLASMQGEIPSWLKWIAENKDAIIVGLAGIAAGLLALKLGFTGIQALGIGIAVAGIVMLIQDIIDFMNDPSWEKFSEILLDISIILLGISITLAGMGKFGLAKKIAGISLLILGLGIIIKGVIDYLNDSSWSNFGTIIEGVGIVIIGLGLLIGNIPLIIAGAIVLILGLLAKNWEKIQTGFKKAKEWIDNLVGKLFEWFIKNIDKIYEKFGYLGLGVMAVVLGAVKYVAELVKGLIDMVFNLLNGLFKGFKGIIDGIIKICKGDLAGGLKEIFKGIGNVFIGVLNAISSAVNAVLYPVRQLIVAFGKISGKNWSIDNIKIPSIPYLASGGIINYPNHGVMLGGAIAGERGAEGVIPLTDSQAMETLGEAIGRYITINATITNSMNGRVLSREMRRIQAEQDFAYNR